MGNIFKTKPVSFLFYILLKQGKMFDFLCPKCMGHIRVIEGADAGRYTYFKIGDKFRKYF